jgi:hypothetical protein
MVGFLTMDFTYFVCWFQEGRGEIFGSYWGRRSELLCLGRWVGLGVWGRLLSNPFREVV